MKSASKVWNVPLLAMALVAAAVPVLAQNQPGPATTQQLAQQAEIMQRQVLAESIVTRDEAALGRKFDPQFRTTILKSLTAKSIADMQQIPTGSAALVVSEAIGDSAADLVYTPVAPCRIIDTRIAGGPIAAGSTRNFLAAGSGFSGQGGITGSCGIPFGPATAVVINFVAVTPTAPGDLRVYPFGGSLPLASIINYIPNQNVANGVPTTICNPAVSACSSDITILAEAAATNVVADVEGYFAAPVATALDCITLGSASTVVHYNAWTAIDAVCPAGRTATGGGDLTAEGTLGYPGIWTVSLPGAAYGFNGWRTWVDNQTGGDRSLQTYVTCCRIPGR